jgi:hypothetical protein
MQVTGRNSDILPITSIQVDAEEFETPASVEMASPAGWTIVTRYDRIDDHDIPRIEPHDFAAYLYNSASKLMPLNGRICHSIAELTAVDM